MRSSKSSAPGGAFLVPILALAVVVLAGLALWLYFGGKGGDLVTLGKEEVVEIGAGEESVEVLAKVDTGAGYSSVDEDLAESLGVDLENPEDTVKIDSANGKKERPLVPVRLKVAGETLDTRVTVSDRSGLSREMLLGRRDLEGFLIEPSEERLTSPDGPRP